MEQEEKDRSLQSEDTQATEEERCWLCWHIFPREVLHHLSFDAGKCYAVCDACAERVVTVL